MCRLPIYCGTCCCRARFAVFFFSGHKLALWHCFARRWAVLKFLVIRNRLRFIASAAIEFKTFWAIKVCLLEHTTRRSYLSLHLFFNHGRPTCHFVENFLVLDFSYSFDWSQAAFGAFSFFFSSTTLETPEIYFHIFLFCTQSVYGRTRNDQKAGKVRENNSLATSSSTCQTEDYFFNEKFYLKTLNTKKTQWKHLLYISNRFFIDGSSWNPCSLRANVSVLLRSGVF